MSVGLDYRMGVGFLVLLLAGPLFGQAANGQIQSEVPVATAAASVPEPEGSSTKQRSDNSFVIGNDDLLAINVWNEPDFKQSVPPSVPVRSDGKISLPLVGDIQAAGRTPLQLEQDIASKLRSYITQPDVTVMVLQINSQKFNILGRVAKPGSYSLSATTTVLDAIAEAGGFLDFAKQKDVYILRKDLSGGQSRLAFNYKDVIKGKHPEQNVKLEPHDTIIVP